MKYDLKYLYRHLRPIDSSTNNDDVGTDYQSIDSIIQSLILNPNNRFYSWQEIQDKINTYFTNRSSAEKEKKDLSLFFHGISNDKKSPIIKLNDASYWKKEEKVISSLNDFLVPRNVQDVTKTNVTVSSFVVKNPYITPASRGTSNIDFFLNYIPPIIASQMVPYLNIEFQIQKTDSDYLTTPSSYRFLLGSKKVDEITASSDKSLISSELIRNQKEENRYDAYSGMELFLMPQTLTNMDELGPSTSRLVRAKPFLPLASIENFEVTVRNAGAGSFANKTASLRLKLHDKSRISEFSEFIRGSSGYNRTLVWSTYGWIAPLNQGVDNEYVQFINKNMILRECWQVVNPQFSFDAAGQASLTIQLVSKSIRNIEELTIAANDSTLGTLYNKLNQAIETLALVSQKLSGEKGFALSTLSEQVLNAATTTGNFGSIKEVNAVVTKLLESVKKSKNLDKKTYEEFERDLRLLSGDPTKKGDAGKSLYDQASDKAKSVVKDMFDKITQVSDPFLPPKNTKEDDEYFNKKLRTEIETFTANSYTNSKKITDTKLKISGYEPREPVVSFGKLFMNFVAPAIANSGLCDELQVFFYSMNDQTGPMSDASIAEFPIDMYSLAYAYSDALTNARTESLTLQQFLKVVIDTQFSNKASIGYGMNRFYQPFSPGKQQEVKEKEYENGFGSWAADYGDFKPPIIEMYIESGEMLDSSEDNTSTVNSLLKGAYRYQTDLNSNNGNGKIIKRIHIYDKQANPYSLYQQVFDGGNGRFEAGKINKTKLQNIISNAITNKKLSPAAKQELQDAASNKDINKILSIAGITQSEVEFKVIDRPGGQAIQIPKDRKTFKESLMKFVPTISIGTNGTMVLAANVASKTDGLQGAINIRNAASNNGKGKSSVSANGLEEIDHLPMKTVPVQVTMTTMGVPTAQLYQSYFVDFDTGTTIDNLYSCTQLQHSITQGKFTTNWTFTYTNGYGKFTSPMDLGQLVTNIAADVVKGSKP